MDGVKWLVAGATLTMGMAWAQSAVSEREFLAAAKRSFYLNEPSEFSRFLDTTLAACNATKDDPPQQQAQRLMRREAASIVYPASGQLMGDWKKGRQWAEETHGGRIGVKGFKDADDPRHANGANCYACHAIDPNFPQAGNMGPPLTQYGVLRPLTPEIVKYTYDKIFNAKAFNACSLMPRYGGKGRLLTPEQVADLVAFLMSPESPVNQGAKQ